MKMDEKFRMIKKVIYIIGDCFSPCVCVFFCLIRFIIDEVNNKINGILWELIKKKKKKEWLF